MREAFQGLEPAGPFHEALEVLTRVQGNSDAEAKEAHRQISKVHARREVAIRNAKNVMRILTGGGLPVFDRATWGTRRWKTYLSLWWERGNWKLEIRCSDSVPQLRVHEKDVFGNWDVLENVLLLDEEPLRLQLRDLLSKIAST